MERLLCILLLKKNNVPLIKSLLNKGANKEIRNGWNKTPAECAGGKFAFNLINNHQPGMEYQDLDDISDDDDK